MKTTNNAQKTENRKIENAISKTFVVVLSLVLFSLTVNANGFRKHLLVNNSNTETTNEIIEAELTIQAEALMNRIEYNATEIVSDEIAMEIESFKNNNAETNNEVAEVELALQFEVKYNAQEFVADEMANEINNYQGIETIK